MQPHTSTGANARRLRTLRIGVLVMMCALLCLPWHTVYEHHVSVGLGPDSHTTSYTDTTGALHRGYADFGIVSFAIPLGGGIGLLGEHLLQRRPPRWGFWHSLWAGLQSAGFLLVCCALLIVNPHNCARIETHLAQPVFALLAGLTALLALARLWFVNRRTENAGARSSPQP